MSTNRRRLIQYGLVSAGLPLIPTAAIGATANPSGTHIITVGAGADYEDLASALRNISDASASTPYLVRILPGQHHLWMTSQPLTVPPHVHVAGVQRNAVTLVLGGNASIQPSSNTSLSDCTLIQLGPGAAIDSQIAGITDFRMSNVSVETRGQAGATAVLLRNYVERAVLENVSVVTSGTGIHLTAGGHVTLHNVDVQLVTGAEADAHIGLRAGGYSRIWCFGGRVGTGYGYNKIQDSGQSVVGLLIDPDAKGRIQLQNVWSICRQEVATPSTITNCIRNESAELRVRVHGGYFQAEGPTAKTLYSAPNGRIEIYGARIRDFGGTPTFSTNQIGLSRYTAADNNYRIPQESGGLILCNAGAGSFVLKLPAGWITDTEQYIFKKTDPTNNEVLISASGTFTIEGESSKRLTRQFETLHLRLGGDTWYLV